MAVEEAKAAPAIAKVWAVGSSISGSSIGIHCFVNESMKPSSQSVHLFKFPYLQVIQFREIHGETVSRTSFWIAGGFPLTKESTEKV